MLMSPWRTSTYSAACGNCAEVAAWRTSSRCEGGACVEVGAGPAVVGIRDSKLERSPVLVFPAGAWREFAGRVRREGSAGG